MSIKRAYQQLKNIYHFFQAHAWRLVYGRPDQGMSIYGITGTNGKTTTSHLLAAILDKQYGAEKVGMLTTIAFRVGNKREINETKLTTLPSKLVYSYLKRMKQEGITHVVLEMTSHALDQNRLAGIKLDGAIILNIAREHLDYHRTMEEYAAAKARIRQYLKPNAPIVGKGDDINVKKILVPVGQAILFTADQARSLNTPLEGDVNKENALAASLLAKSVGVSQSAIDAGIASVTSVPGRMEWITVPQGFKIVIDYAVTPDALDRLYAYVKSKTTGRVLAILGAAGLRDRGKRPDMARAVANYANHIVITREDPWTESEEQIFSDLEQGLQNTSVPWQRIVDRKEAIASLITQAKPGDTIVLTGKGAETGMGIGADIVPYSERAVVEALIATV